MPNAVIAHAPDGRFDVAALKMRAAAIPSMDGLDLVPGVTSAQSQIWDETTWTRAGATAARLRPSARSSPSTSA